MNKRRNIIRDGEPSPLDMTLTPEILWRVWVQQIAADPQMDKDRVLRHLQRHVGEHMPNEDAPVERWEEWMGGVYNLLAILGHMVGVDPPHEVGVSLLLNKWQKKPDDHTPPPVKEETAKRASKKKKQDDYDYGCS